MIWLIGSPPQKHECRAFLDTSREAIAFRDAVLSRCVQNLAHHTIGPRGGALQQWQGEESVRRATLNRRCCKASTWTTTSPGHWRRPSGCMVCAGHAIATLLEIVEGRFVVSDEDSDSESGSGDEGTWPDAVYSQIDRQRAIPELCAPCYVTLRYATLGCVAYVIGLRYEQGS